MKTIAKNARLFAKTRDEKLVEQWQKQNPKNKPLPPSYGVIAINGELIAARLLSAFIEENWQ